MIVCRERVASFAARGSTTRDVAGKPRDSTLKSVLLGALVLTWIWTTPASACETPEADPDGANAAVPVIVVLHRDRIAGANLREAVRTVAAELGLEPENIWVASIVGFSTRLEGQDPDELARDPRVEYVEIDQKIERPTPPEKAPKETATPCPASN